MTTPEYPSLCCINSIDKAEKGEDSHRYYCSVCGCDVSMIRMWYNNRDITGSWENKMSGLS